MNLLISQTRKFELKTSTILQLFDSSVGSIFYNSCEVWGNSKSKCIERVHYSYSYKELLFAAACFVLSSQAKEER